MPELTKSREQYFQQLRATNAVIRDLSQRLGTLCVDCESPPVLQDPANLSSDLKHPNMLGYLVAAAEMARRLEAHTGIEIRSPLLPLQPMNREASDLADDDDLS